MTTTNGARESLPPLDVIWDRPTKDGQRRATLGHDGIAVATVEYYPDGVSEKYLGVLRAAPDLHAACARIERRHGADEGGWLLDDDEIAALRAALARPGGAR